jgi:hypothetical protein
MLKGTRQSAKPHQQLERDLPNTCGMARRGVADNLHRLEMEVTQTEQKNTLDHTTEQ